MTLRDWIFGQKEKPADPEPVAVNEPDPPPRSMKPDAVVAWKDRNGRMHGSADAAIDANFRQALTDLVFPPMRYYPVQQITAESAIARIAANRAFVRRVLDEAEGAEK